MITNAPRTRRGCRRQYDSIVRACRRDLAGGLSFGMDWPTIRATFPERYQRIGELRAMYRSLPA